MKRTIGFVLLAIFLSLMQQSAGAQEKAWSKTIKVDTGNGTRDVKAVWIDMKDPMYRAEVALAKGCVGQTDSFKNIAEQLSDSETEVVAAINGTFFNAYTDLQPTGTIRLKGRTALISNTGTCIGFTGDNKIEFVHLFSSISGSINGNWEYPYNWSVWGINQVYTQADANVMYTPDFGKEVDARSRTAVIVRNGKVTAIQKGISPIHSDGYTLVFGSPVYSGMFKVGDRVDYRLNTNHIDFNKADKKGAELDWSHIRTALGAGPLLVKNGAIVLNAQQEGFTDVKFTSNRAQRSFIGELENGTLVFGTVPNVTLSELATILKNMNVINGMNLDGGASSGLYFKGEILTNPSRNISNAIVITKKKERPARLQLNGKELFFDTDPYFENNTTMVPMRGIAEALGAEAGWDPDTGTLWMKKTDTKVEMWNNSKVVKVNGTERELLAPVRVVYNRTHVPARFMTEIFGGSIYFDYEKYMVVMSMENLDADSTYFRAVDELQKGNTEEALKLFLKALELDPAHAGSMLKLARHYGSKGENEKAKTYYEQFVAIQPNDLNVWNSLGWTYANLGEIQKALNIFETLTQKSPQVAAYWSALGDMYAHYQVQDKAKARMCYEKALTLNPSDSLRASLNEKLKKLSN